MSYLILVFLVSFQMTHANIEDLCSLKSPDGLNVITISLTEKGQPLYRVERRGFILLENSPLGLRCSDQDFSRGLVLKEITEEETDHEQYQLVVGNKRTADTQLARRQVTLENDQGSLFRIDLAASNEGVGFRYLFESGDHATRLITEEITGFQVPSSATAWLQPYHAAGKYTPAYEDFYFRIKPGQAPPVSREKPRGWCLPGLFEVPSAQGWMLIAETGADGSYCACHLKSEPPSNLYQIAFAYEDEVTAGKSFNPQAKPAPVLSRATPWRVLILGDEAKDILNSTFITDLAAPSRIEDTSWIEPGRASWSWWSHPEVDDTTERYNHFTDLAAEYGWEYTLFDAGWWNTDLKAICRYAETNGIKPIAWMHAVDFYEPEKRRRKMDELVSQGIRGIKVDFWCSDRQETMAAIHGTLQDAAERKLVVSLHGCTIPRGWHRTWPNLLTAEGVLGTECYFYEELYPDKVAELNTILPFTRNVLAPMDTTPVALAIRKFPRKTMAVHELAAAIVASSGIIHYADSVETFLGFPKEVKEVLRQAPASWDETICLIGEPGRRIVLARRTGQQWFIAGLNGTHESIAVSLNLDRFNDLDCIEITEGKDPILDFSIEKRKNGSVWQHQMPPLGGFVLHLKPADRPLQ